MKDPVLLTTIHGSNPAHDRNLYTNKSINLQDMMIINRRFMGAGMSQNYAALYFFEYFQEAHRFQYIIEIGSQKGALSMYFASMAAITESYFFDTFELYPNTDWYSRPNEGVGHWYDKISEISPYIDYHHTDIFSSEAFDMIKDNAKNLKTLIFCDGGNKPKEFNMYAPLLKKDDRLVVHDWGHEIRLDQIEKTMKDLNIVIDEPFATSANNLQTRLMPFRKN